MAAFSTSTLSAINSTTQGAILNQLHARILGLSMTGLGSGKWAICLVPWLPQLAKEVGYPCGVISPFDEELPDANTLLGLNRTVFKYVIGIARANNFDQQNSMNVVMEWYQTLRLSFRNTAATDLAPGGGGVRMGKTNIIQAGSFIDDDFRKGADSLFYIIGVEADEAFG